MCARPAVLVTNDDGIASPGLTALVEALKPMGDVYVVAPEFEMSGVSSSLSFETPLKCRWVDAHTVALASTPVACVKFAFNEWFADVKPVLVASGINRGPNLGNDVNYSGTVAAALEGAFQGVPAVAVSFADRFATSFEGLDRFIRTVAEGLGRREWPSGSCLNVNIPSGPPDQIKGLKMTRQGRRIYYDEMVKESSENGETHVRLRITREAGWVSEEGTDVEAVAQGWVSVTPLSLDYTHHGLLKELMGWDWNGGA